ncbi:hypothetical protein [Desulfococcus sp.]|uniref:hypothetical protein n=1 Tax=Desulfococcus sp. TaxID=2025834 RepID=UPI00359403FB
MTAKYKRIFSAAWIMGSLLGLLLCPGTIRTGHAAFGEDIEKPKPEFSREGDRVTAKYIPRAKSTSVQVHFTVSGGKLVEVRGLEWEIAERPEVDVKNFKSALFTIEIGDVSPGAEAMVTLSSDFFTSSTQFYVFNEKLSSPWMVSECENISLPDRVQDLVIKVIDGGPYDSDGTVNGRIFFVGGPRDSFWAYALGTLFIRFFGIFLVLGILQICMELSGRIFQKMDINNSQKGMRSESEPLEDVSIPQAIGNDDGEQAIDTESVSAAAVALHIHLSRLRAPERLELGTSESTGWIQHGRQMAMGANPSNTRR